MPCLVYTRKVWSFLGPVPSETEEPGKTKQRKHQQAKINKDLKTFGRSTPHNDAQLLHPENPQAREPGTTLVHAPS